MAKRGDELRDHMLHVAKDVFLEAGFERASMDVIAANAGTTKKSLYAHFENKEKLYLAVVELSRTLAMGRLKQPGEYAEDPADALLLFCARFLELALWNRSVKMYRLSIAECERFPDGAARLHEAIFETAEERIATFLRERVNVPKKAAEKAASDLLARVLYPRFVRALFGIGVLMEDRLRDERISAEIDLKPIRRVVAEILTMLRA